MVAPAGQGRARTAALGRLGPHPNPAEVGLALVSAASRVPAEGAGAEAPRRLRRWWPGQSHLEQARSETEKLTTLPAGLST